MLILLEVKFLREAISKNIVQSSLKIISIFVNIIMVNKLYKM